MKIFYCDICGKKIVPGARNYSLKINFCDDDFKTGTDLYIDEFCRDCKAEIINHIESMKDQNNER